MLRVRCLLAHSSSLYSERDDGGRRERYGCKPL